MIKFLASVKKEFLLLIRDIPALAMLFLMPIALVLIMTLLQDSSFKSLKENSISVAIINNDKAVFGNNIVKGLEKSEFFKTTLFNNKSIETLKKDITAGTFMIGIVINKDASQTIIKNLNKEIYQQFPIEITETVTLDTTGAGAVAKVDVFFDPVLKNSFKQSLLSALHEFSSGVEAKIIYDTYASLFKELLGIEMKKVSQQPKLIEFNEQYASTLKESIIPNSVQHNVPAYTLFAIFFIVIPLAGNIIRERTSGVSLRLRTIPGAIVPALFGKVFVYFIVGLLQAFVMLLIGLYVLPWFGMPTLTIGKHWPALLLMTIAISAAASGYGIIIGTISSSQSQASIFGSISVVIMAAIGGIWVPTFMMSEMMQQVSKLSPLNWGLNGYYSILLRNAGFVDILPYILALVAFSLATLAGAYLYTKKQSVNR